MHEATLVNVANPSDDDLNEKLKNIIVTGYSKGGNDESAGVSIQAQKLLKSGQILNLSVPFTKYEDESGDGYLYGAELKEAIGRCSYEVDAYLFEGKYGIKQESFDFDTPEESDITGGSAAVGQARAGQGDRRGGESLRRVRLTNNKNNRYANHFTKHGKGTMLRGKV